MCYFVLIFCAFLSVCLSVLPYGEIKVYKNGDGKYDRGTACFILYGDWHKLDMNDFRS